mgnify:CR=1 FL=1
MEIQTQNEYIYEWLLAGNSITTLDAMLHHHIGRLASRICDLVNDYAVPIQKEREPNKERQGLPYEILHETRVSENTPRSTFEKRTQFYRTFQKLTTRKMQELKPNTKFSLTIEGKEIVLETKHVKNATCDGCYFRKGSTCSLTDATENIVGMCSSKVRTDNTSVIFKQSQQ